MAGMFYSLKETAEKLGIAEDQVKQLAEDGKLREFRDGSSLLFKIDEVNALLTEGVEMTVEPDVEMDLGPEEAGAADTSAEPEFEPVAPAPEAEPVEEDLPIELESSGLEMPAEAEATSELDLVSEADGEGTREFAAEDLLAGAEEPQEEPVADLGDDDISLAPETGILAAGSDITDMDTALTGQGIDVLGETDSDDYGLTDDSLAETVGPAGTSTEASLEEIEGDVNLDSFGSGSGLLDLSLQADDTSLGGILDEIYTADGGEEEPHASGSGPVDDLTAEVEHVGHEDELAVPEPVMAGVAAMGHTYAEAPPDSQSNILGMLLFLPLLVLLYTAVVAWSGQKHIMPSILESIQGLVWYIIGGAAVLTAIVVGASFVVGGEKAPRAAKPKKEKKAKAPKEKKAKKEKAPKAEKPKKEKKPLFGKKK